MRPIPYFLLTLWLPLAAYAAQPPQACLITSVDTLEPIRLCQQNINIPAQLFAGGFCQPQIPDREFQIEMRAVCPDGAYGICTGAKTDGVAYQQAIHYYSDPDDAPVLRAYCEQISQGRWLDTDASE